MQISNVPLDFSGKSLNQFERSTITQIANLQDQEVQLSIGRYEMTKYVGEKGIPFLDGITEVENIEDYLQGLVNRAKNFGGKDVHGVEAQQYAQLAEAKGIFVDFEV
ncbi:hypothetical protein [Salinibius halmophilus]|uniref:hypothetical protein n=1 Tax=Salinibius halmophilus TaxID=1853216 RepID=UPI000E663EA9|nr:hypothetical protein [Salinibius halmophilus]